ncbi:MAG: ATP-dependent helicase C-terminal domain-containing protein, partial [Longimicrobiales bacterium]
VRRKGLGALPWTKETSQLRDRLRFLHTLEPQQWPDMSDDALTTSLEMWLLPFLAGMTSLDDLRKLDLTEALIARVGWQRRDSIEALAPERIEVPSGSRIRIDYSDPHAPTLAARIQELFGMAETPRIGDGRVPLTIALLSPAMRPVQVTRDLASFWRDTYFDVRKDLRGRYPKHSWPENPLDAPATRRARPRGG